MTKTKRMLLLQPASTGGNFEYIAIPRQGMLFLSGALAQWNGPYHYEREIWFEDRSGLIDVEQDLKDVDILLLTALINEAPRAYQIARQAKQYYPDIVTVGVAGQSFHGTLKCPAANAAGAIGQRRLRFPRRGAVVLHQVGIEGARP